MNQVHTLEKIRWEIESRCNLNCKHCFIGDKFDNLSSLNLSQAIELVDQMYAMGLRKLDFTTKEPLLFDNLPKLIKHCKQKGIIMNVVTNGTLLADYNLAKELVESGVSSISISMEGISPETNDYIRGKGSFNQVMEALANIQKIQNGKKNVHIGIQMTLNSMSIAEAKQLPSFFNQLQIDSLHIGNISIDGNAVDHNHLFVDEKQYIEAWKIILTEYMQLEDKKFMIMPKALLPHEAIYYNIIFNTDFAPTPPGCSIINGVYSLLPDGKLIPCVSLIGKPYLQMPSANLIAGEKFDQLIEFNEVINEFIHNNKSEICNNCHYNSKCQPCPASIKGEYVDSILYNRCKAGIENIANYLDQVEEKPENYYVQLRENVILKEDGQNVVMKKYYQNGMVTECAYQMNSTGITILKMFFKKTTVPVNLLIQDKFAGNSIDAIEFLKTLVLDNFVMIKEVE